MKLAVDTNVLVRYLVGDDPVQARQATAQIESADGVFIPIIVLCETAWVLKRTYRYSAEEIAAVLSTLVHSRNVEVNRAAAEAGLSMLSRGGDFADGVVEHEAVDAKCDRLATFDRNFERLLRPTLRDPRGAH